jgi:hypothetical protein
VPPVTLGPTRVALEVFARLDARGEIAELRLHQNSRIIRQLSEAFVNTAPWYARWSVQMNASFRRIVGGAGDWVRRWLPSQSARHAAKEVWDRFGREEHTLHPLKLRSRVRYHADAHPLPHWQEDSPWDAACQAASYRNGRVLLAGDAAHIHPPQGGQGLGTGVQDAVNLGWKLAQVVAGTSPDSLLDTYHDERHPVGARVIHNTMAQVALGRPDERSQAARDTVHDLLSADEPRRRIVGMLSGLDIRYELEGDHPLVGRRVPDLDIETSDGPTRVFTLLHAARPVLLNLTEPRRFGLREWAPRLRVDDARSEGRWELPVVGEI